MSRALTTTAPSTTDPRFTTVVSASGFNAGDYVYQLPDGSYGVVPDGAAATAPFNVNQTFANLNADVSVYAGYKPLPVGGISRKDMVAKLSDGNLVFVYRQGASVGGLSAARAIFTVQDPTGATVVSPTQISNTLFPSQGTVSVIALTGGGFVVYYLDASTFKPTFGVFTNAGAVTTAIATDAGATAALGAPGTDYQVMYGCALPNGGFAFSYPTSTPTIVVRAYDSVGTPAYAWTSLGATQGGLYQACRIAARSDSTTAVIFFTSTAQQLSISRITTDGAVISTTFSVTSQSGAGQYMDICCLPNDTFLVVYYNNPGNNSNLAPSFRTLPVSNTLSAQTSVPTGGTVVSLNATHCNIYAVPLSSGGFIVFYNDSNGLMYYVPYNSSEVALNSGTNVSCFGELASFGIAMHPAFIERSGYLDIYYAVGADSNASGASGGLQYYNYKSTMELTNYTIYSAASTTALLGTTTQPVTNYARDGSTPNGAAFFPTTTGVVATDFNRSATTLTPILADADYLSNSANFALTTNSTGQILIVYKASTSSAFRALLYSNTGILLKAITVSTWNLSGNGTMDAVFLSDGKILIGEGRTSNLADFYIYDSTLTTLLTSITGVYANGGKVGVAGLTGLIDGRFVFVHVNASGFPAYALYSNTGAVLQSSATFDSQAASSTAQISVCAIAGGGFAARWYSSGAAQDRIAMYFEGATNSWSQSLLISSGGSTTNYSGGKFAISSNSGIAYFATGSSTGITNFVAVVPTSAAWVATNTGITLESAVNINTKFTLGITGSGIPVLLNAGASSAGVYVFNVGFKAATFSSTVSTITNYASSNIYLTAAPWFGNNVVVAYRDADSRINFGILNVAPYSTSANLITNVTVSNKALSLNPSNASKYTLLGVAASDCAAGGAGQVQTNGIAKLNSQFSASTAFQGFDFQVPGNQGVRGTVAGNLVNLIGDA